MTRLIEHRLKPAVVIAALLTVVLALEPAQGLRVVFALSPFTTPWDSAPDESEDEETEESSAMAAIRRDAALRPSRHSPIASDRSPARHAAHRLRPAWRPSPSGLGFALRC